MAEFDRRTGLHLDANPAYCRLTGCTLAELQHITVAALFNQPTLPAVAEFQTGRDGRWLRLAQMELPGGPRQVLLEDITARKSAEMEWVSTRERFDLAMRATNQGIWDWDVVTGADYFSEQWCALLGFTREELHPSYGTWVSLLHPEDRDRMLEQVRKHLEDRLPYDAECRMRHASGVYKWYRCMGQAQWDAAGKPLRMSGSITDLTAQKSSECDARESRERHRLAVELSGQVAYEYDIARNVAAVYGDCDGVLGYSAAELRPGLTFWLTLVHPDDVDRLRTAVERLIEHDQPFRLEYRLRRKTGEYFWIEDSCRAFWNEEKTCRQLIGQVADVSERVAMEQSLREANDELESRVADRTLALSAANLQLQQEVALRQAAEERLRLSEERLQWGLRGSEYGLWDCTLGTAATIYVDENYARILGYTGDEITAIFARDTFSMVHPDDREPMHLWARDHLGDFTAHYEMRHRLQHKNGAWIWVVSRGQLLPQENAAAARRMVGTICDITSQVELEEQLRAAFAEAQRANQAKSAFLAAMSHEIRTPLNGIIGLANLLQATPLDPEQKDYASKITSCADHLRLTLNDVLDFSKIEAGKVALENIAFALRPLIDEAVRLVSPQAESKALTVSCDLSGLPERMVMGDPGRLRQILLNLLTNAVKFTSSGAVRVSAAMVAEQEDGITVRFAVADSGIGIAEDKLRLLFQPFSQADSSTTRRFGGTGLGLVISRQLTELQGGTVGVESEVGVGSRFWFTIPYVYAEPAAQQSAAAAAVTRFDGLRILVAEDNAVNQLVATQLLLKRGAQVDVAGNGSIAVRRAAEARYDLILMDCHMPEMDGFEATRAIRAAEGDRQHTAIVALTAAATLSERELCFTVGMDDYLSKPLDVDRLFAAVQRHARPVASVSS